MVLTLPTGFRAAGVHAGIKPPGRGLDLALMVADAPAPAAAVFTRNALRSAHIEVCQRHLERSGGLVRALLVNSGCANCATGEAGVAAAERCAAALAEAFGCAPEQVLPVSTGAIGSALPVERVLAALPGLVERCGADGVEAFARAIMTTDTVPKLTAGALAGGAWMVGMAKGSGMIHPDMATMLAFLVTDAGSGDELGTALRRAVDRSFHRVSVDGDTSPNDTVVLWASGAVDARLVSGDAGLDAVAQDLARKVAADGEGASRLITVEVRGAATEAEAARVGRVVATSPLCKTAVAGRDPNWGRILAAAGRADAAVDVVRARVWIGDTVLYEQGRPWPEREPAAAAHLAGQREVVLGVDLAVGAASADVWTCDLTADYVRINADYRT